MQGEKGSSAQEKIKHVQGIQLQKSLGHLSDPHASPESTFNCRLNFKTFLSPSWGLRDRGKKMLTEFPIKESTAPQI